MSWKSEVLSALPAKYRTVVLRPLRNTNRVRDIVDRYYSFWNRANPEGRKNLPDSTPDNKRDISKWLDQQCSDENLLMTLIFYKKQLIGHLDLSATQQEDMLRLSSYNGFVELRNQGLMNEAAIGLLSVMKNINPDAKVIYQPEELIIPLRLR